MKRVLFLLSVILLLTNCVTYKLELYLYKDNAKLVYSLMMDKKQIPYDSIGNIKKELKDTSITISDDENFIVFSKDILINEEDYEDYGIILSGRFTGYELKFSPYKAMRINKDFSPDINAQIPIEISIYIENGKIVNCNKGNIKNNSIILKTNISDINNEFIITTNVRQYNSILPFVFFIGIIIIFILVIVFLQIKEHKNANK